MYYINKIALFIANPISIGVLLVVLGFVLKWVGIRKAERLGPKRTRRLFVFAWGSLAVAAFWFLFWSFPATGRLVGWAAGLDEYGKTVVGELPVADAIVDLGGGMGGWPEDPYADMSAGGYRVWHAARLYRAGKAPVVITSGKWTEYTDKPLLMGLGVPEQAILVDDQSRNTEENAIFTHSRNGLEL